MFDELARKACFVGVIAFIDKENTHAIELAKRAGFVRETQAVVGKEYFRTELEVYYILL